MKKFLVVQIIAIVGAAFAITLPSRAAAGRLKSLATGCVHLLAGRTIFDGPDPVGQWIHLPEHEPPLAEVLAADDGTLTVGWTDPDTLLHQNQSIPKPGVTYLASPKARAQYEATLSEGRRRSAVRDPGLIGQVARFPDGIGLARILAASPEQFELEYLGKHQIERISIGRPVEFKIIPDADFGEITRRGRLMGRYPLVRSGAYVTWAPNVVVKRVLDSPVYVGGGIRLFYQTPWDLPYTPTLLGQLEQNAIHARITGVDLLHGTLALNSLGRTLILPMRPELLERSAFGPSPTGELDELPRQGFADSVTFAICSYGGSSGRARRCLISGNRQGTRYIRHERISTDYAWAESKRSA